MPAALPYRGYIFGLRVCAAQRRFFSGESSRFQKKQTIYAQGANCDAVFYIQKGKVRLTVVSKNGNEATIGILNPGDFFGEQNCTPLNDGWKRASNGHTAESCILIDSDFSSRFSGFSTASLRQGLRHSAP